MKNYHLEDNDFPFHFQKVFLDEPYLFTLVKKGLWIALFILLIAVPAYKFGYHKAENKTIVHKSEPVDCHEDQIAYYNKVLLKQCYTELKAFKKPNITPTPAKKTHAGLASFYSRAGCLGCSKNFTMANGEPLDDSKITVAYNRAPLNGYITITNSDNGKSVSARVTDRGGFESVSVPKIVDLSVATKEALECASTCRVEITL